MHPTEAPQLLRLGLRGLQCHHPSHNSFCRKGTKQELTQSHRMYVLVLLHDSSKHRFFRSLSLCMLFSVSLLSVAAKPVRIPDSSASAILQALVKQLKAYSKFPCSHFVGTLEHFFHFVGIPPSWICFFFSSFCFFWQLRLLSFYHINYRCCIFYPK